jgi:hypothetical protein
MPSLIRHWQPAIYRCRAAILATFVAGASSCKGLLGCSDSVQAVSLSAIDGNTYITSLVLWPGDTFLLTATAGGDETNELCPGHTIYTSSSDPGQFEYFTSDSSVAKISSGAVVTAVGVGTASLYAKSNHISTVSAFSVRVAPPIVQMRYTASPPVGKVGDTVVVTLHPIGPDSLPVASPAISPMRWFGPGVTDGPWLKGRIPTIENSFVATVAGEIFVQTSVLRSGHPSFVTQLQYNVKP